MKPVTAATGGPPRRTHAVRAGPAWELGAWPAGEEADAPVPRALALSIMSRFPIMAAGLAPQWLRHAALQALRWHARCRHRLYRLVPPPWPWLLALAALFLPVAGFAQGVAPAHDPMPMTSLLWSLRAMVGSWVVLLGVVCVLVWRGPALQTTRGRFALWACVLTLPLPWIAMISGWLVLELGQPAPPSTAVVAAQAATEAAAAGNNASQPSSPAALLGWGCAYALLMFINLKLSLRWLRLEPLQGSVQAGAVTARPRSSSSGGGGFTERLAQRYRPGVGESEFDMVVEEHSRPAPNSSGPMPLMLTDESSGRTFDVDQLRRAIARLRKERNALRKVVKAKQQKRSEHGAHVVAQRAAPAPYAAPVRARGRPGGEGDMRDIPVLNDVVQTPVTRR